MSISLNLNNFVSKYRIQGSTSENRNFEETKDMLEKEISPIKDISAEGKITIHPIINPVVNWNEKSEENWLKEATQKRQVFETGKEFNVLEVDFKESMYLNDISLEDLSQSSANWNKVFDSRFIADLAIKREMWSDRIKESCDGEDEANYLSELENTYNKAADDLISTYADRFKDYFGEEFDSEKFKNNIKKMLQNKSEQLSSIKESNRDKWDELVHNVSTYKGYGGEIQGMNIVSGIRLQRDTSDPSLHIENFFAEKLKELSLNNSAFHTSQAIEEMNYSQLYYTSKTLGSVYGNLNNFLPFSDGITTAASLGQAKSKVMFLSEYVLPGEWKDQLVNGINNLINKKVSKINDFMSQVNSKYGISQSNQYSFEEHPVRKEILQKFTSLYKSTAEDFFTNYSSALDSVRNAINKAYGKTCDSNEYLTRLPEDWNRFIDSMPELASDQRYKFASGCKPILDLKV